jgi:hypothetical protein
MSLPTFDEIKGFIQTHPAATICEIRDHFKQRGDKHFCATNKQIVAFNIKEDFWVHLQQFIKQDYVAVGEDPLACMISDSETCTSKQGFLPIVLSIKS